MPKLDFKADQLQCYMAENVMRRFGKITKIPGDIKFNSTAMPNKILWAERYYGRKADQTYAKHTFAYDASGNIWILDDSSGAINKVYQSLYTNCIPESVTVQVAGNSRIYLMNGYDTMIYHEGDDAGTWYESKISYKFVQGAIKDDRFWGFEKDTSLLLASRTSYPEDFGATYVVAVVVGNDKDSYIKRLELLGNDLYIFKNDSIWVLRGSTKATYKVECLIPNMGLLAQRAITPLASALVFVCNQDREIYEFTGSVSPRLLSGNIRKRTGERTGSFAEMLNPYRIDDMVCVNDTINKLFRLSYKNVAYEEEGISNEVIFPTDDFGEGGQPKWSETHGAYISCYIIATKQNDYFVMTGRSDIGHLMYHNRSRNWDGVPIEVSVWLDDITPNPGFNNDFEWLFIHGKPSSGTVTLRTYLNSRVDSFSNQNFADTGEVYTLGGITMPNQYQFNSSLPLLTGYNHGESIALEIKDATKDKDIEIEDLILNVIPRERIHGTTTGLVG